MKAAAPAPGSDGTSHITGDNIAFENDAGEGSSSSLIDDSVTDRSIASSTAKSAKPKPLSSTAKAHAQRPHSSSSSSSSLSAPKSSQLTKALSPIKKPLSATKASAYHASVSASYPSAAPAQAATTAPAAATAVAEPIELPESLVLSLNSISQYRALSAKDKDKGDIPVVAPSSDVIEFAKMLNEKINSHIHEVKVLEKGMRELFYRLSPHCLLPISLSWTQTI
jgi:cytoskeletal protein RodZ